MADTNYQRLRRVLDEVFMLDQADLDFGIYRIMNVKRDEITRFLDNDLLPQVKITLAGIDEGQRAQVKHELDEAVAQAKSLGVEPDTVKKVQDLRAKYTAGVDLEVLESEVFSHLASFFRRYYKEGDFLSLRRYKEGVYAIPYEGEEVKLHWANADQYYIKSSEQFRDYAFKLGDGRRVHFKLTAADTESDNNKPAAGQERRFILAEDDAIAEEDGELIIRFEYRPDPEGRKRETLNAEAEAKIMAAAPAAWQAALAEKRPTDKSPDRTMLAKHLNDYTARNTFDYFIHKDLGAFLRRELDFYIKNEVMHLDDIENETAPKVDSYLAKIRAIRRIAHKIIDFLAQLEDFQKKLWLKKKFVVETNYCVTLDRVPEELYPDIAANDAQREEWLRLFAIDEIKGDMTQPAYSAPLTVEFLESQPHLTVDSVFFDTSFSDRLLAALTNLDDGIDGLLIDGENFQTLHLVEERYRGTIQCVYTDPPYNTDAGPIAYKNGYRSSSWMSLMDSRLRQAKEFLTQQGVICVTIDDYQVHELAQILDDVFDASQLGVAVVRNNPSGRSTVSGFSVCHEYAFFYGREDAGLARLPRSEKQLDRFTVEDGVHVDWRNFRKDGGAVTHRAERPKQYYPIYIRLSDNTLRIPQLSWNKTQREWDVLEQPAEGESVVWPIDENGKERVWSLNQYSALEHLDTLEVRLSKDGNPQVLRRHIPTEGVLPRSWWDKKTYAAREYGSAALTNLFGGPVFSFAKSPFAVQDCIWIAGLDYDSGETALDFFAGSGTTGHAVINLNREDDGNRKYILVEMGDYFDTVLKPRIQKVIYSKDWKDGKPVSRQGSSHMFKYIRLESYEDALNNLTLKRTDGQQALLDANDELRGDYTLRYMLDVEAKGSASLLNIDAFEDPFSYKLNVASGSAGETRPVNVDLVETFNYLIGLRVKTIDHIQGFRVVTGESPAGEKVLVIWRNTKEKANKALDDFFRKQGYTTKDQEFDIIYVNGDNNLENLRREDETWKVRLIEEDFHRLMFDVQDV